MINTGTKPKVRPSPPHHLGVASTVSNNNVVMTNTTPTFSNSNKIQISSSGRIQQHFTIARGDLKKYLNSGNSLMDGEMFFDTVTSSMYIGYGQKIFKLQTSPVDDSLNVLSKEESLKEANNLKVVGNYFG